MINKDEIRSKFPALNSSTAYLDNAGGSQLPLVVINSMVDYMVNKYVQLGADYELSKQATVTIEEARKFLEVFFNAKNLGKVVMGPSTSSLCATLADCFRRSHDAEKNEVVICQAGHEANVGPWYRLKDSGYEIKTWKLNPDTFQCSLEDLDNLVTSKTRIVAFPHVSNLLGEVVEAKTICQIARNKGAKVVVDGVAYAPHRAIDVADLEADFYVYSTYKVFGPHMAALFGRHEALDELQGPNHYFVDDKDVPYKFELGGVLHEGCAGILGLWQYLSYITGDDPNQKFNRRGVEKAFQIIEDLERPLTEKLLEYLNQKSEVTIIGSEINNNTRVPTISFTHSKKPSKEIAVGANNLGLGIRYGHFYAHRSCEPLALDPDDGVVRVSLVHYNTLAEIDRLCEYFDQVL